MTATALPRERRHDPHRRERIVAACLDVIAERGVAGTSHRRVAAAADVPLGSMTYHFDGMDELLREAFTSFAGQVAEQFEERMAHAADREAAVDAVVHLITRDVFATQRDLVLTHELYTLAARDPAYRTLTNAWMARSRAALERHFDPLTTRLLDAVIEGVTIHRALDTEARADSDVVEAVRRITATA
ncbi:TetR family transcriptional regulator [Paraoerskovia sediminicola]|uniref:TetR family transcriptional regulator n=1 Tax=Paraoerskovia sediminicola TaxID=1138587 RepID=A0ABN6XAZ6_9CELL|nr:TetR family transcriptional regulator [Paraoerskovia sediminicola]BDZ42127.1 TetR family transcriptional regulator [Paraoerskovia sediminicola]